MSSSSSILALLSLICFTGQGLITRVAAKSHVHIVYMGDRQHDNTKLITDSHHDLLATVVGSRELASELMVYSYKHGFSGFAAKLTESQTQQLSELPGVVRIIPNSLHKLETTRSWDFLGLSPHSPSNILPKSNMGDGVIIGVLDTAGSFVANISYKGLGLGTIRGGAPKARLAIYKVCWNVLGGKCSTADMLKAFDEAIHDGVDVLSLSIGHPIPLFSDVDERDGIATGSFHAVAKGITVVCGAGNNGPSAQTVSNTAPWIITVAASTMDREFPTSITLGNNKTFLGQAMFTGTEIGFTSLVYPESKGLTTRGVCESLSLNKTIVVGKVVLCFTTMGRRAITNASAVVKEAGGVGLIIAKNPSDALYPCNEDFPCIEVDYEIGTRILFYIRSTRYPLVKLIPPQTIVGKPLSAKVAYFSSRGPNSITPATLKPDIAAPGVNILAATSPLYSFVEGGYAMMSGTSMSTPHVTGIVALIKRMHPNWSPAAIKSALVTTAWRNGPSGLPIFAEGSPQKLANSFDFGGGLVNPNGAAEPGLVYDMGAADYMEYLCARAYNNSAISRLTGKKTTCPVKKPSILDVNLPSVTIPSLRNPVTVKRTVTNVGAPESIYKATIEPPFGTIVYVNPTALVFNSTVEKLTFTITISAIHEMNTGYYFGSLTWVDGVHAVRIPLSVRTEFLQPHDDDDDED
ncbi:subtilisin-like protease SBT3.4 isoform X3 [Malus domestica]|uniref:subtilisin-like protease SBT3.4 isoform X3 n=1 Tax=Malus domestica TaxID=3750 RepID=UPI0010AABD75|nr:subtilisin-like protease SBT3.3 isoform X3 [Malus domestica]